jgi:hypothetical protein
VNGRDRVQQQQNREIENGEPVLKLGPNTACGGNARKRA